MLDLLSLKLFVSCVDLGSLSNVSKEHHIALAALSRRIILLEDNYGVQLLDRTGRGVKPTNAGIALYKHAHEIFEKIRITQADLNDYVDGKKGKVSIILSTSIINYDLPKQLREFSRVHPHIRLEIDEAFTSKAIDSVRSHKHELGILLKSNFIEDMTTIPYGVDELVIVSYFNITFTGVKIRFKDIVNYDFVLMDGMTAISKELSQAALALDHILKVRVRVSSFETVCRMVEAGFGIGIIPIKIAKQCAKIMDIRVYKLDEEWAKREFFICYLNSKTLSSSSEKLIQHLMNLEK
jgi:DNA-binding transcriptional LysR family regulator